VHSLIAQDYNLFAATLGAGIFHSVDNGFSWEAISITYFEWIGPEYISPVYSLAVIDTTIVAAAGPGYIFYAPLAEPKFTNDWVVRQGYTPILCIAYGHGALYAGS